MRWRNCLPLPCLPQLEVKAHKYSAAQIRSLYDGDRYRLPRRYLNSSYPAGLTTATRPHLRAGKLTALHQVLINFRHAKKMFKLSERPAKVIGPFPQRKSTGCMLSTLRSPRCEVVLTLAPKRRP
jgi:hypothetical protein